MSSVASLALLAILFTGCSSPSSLPATSAQPILQGDPDPDGDPSVVFVEAVPVDGGWSFCTGTVISPHVVLTAAHCVDPAEIGGDIKSVRIYLGDVQDLTAMNDYSHWRPAREWHFNPDFNQDGRLVHDTGVVVFDDPIPRTPLPLMLRSLDQADRGAPLRLVGFGIHRYNDNLSVGARYQTTTALTGFTDQLVEYTGNAHSICHGDSGGPSFLVDEGVERVVGVHSFTAGGCVGTANDSRVDSNLYWLAPYIEANDPGTLPPGTGAIVDGGVDQAGAPVVAAHGCALGGGAGGSGMWIVALVGLWMRRRVHGRRKQVGSGLRFG